MNKFKEILNKLENESNGGNGALSILLIAFVILKLCHVIDWSWWWVLSPIWLPLLISLVLICMGVTIKILLDHIKG